MGQILKRRKKGRYHQSDDSDLLLKSKSPAPESDYRRSLRRRNARPIIDYDDYLDEYEEEIMLADEEEDEDDDEDEEGERISFIEKRTRRRRRRKTKKLQSVVKLAQYESDSRRSRRGGRATRGAVEEDDDDDYEVEAHNNFDGESDEEEDEEGVPKGDAKEEEDPGTPIETRIVVPLPDKKLLELILDKLQKKDIYGVYAEPVDPEELPDYFDIIKHPMDFATVRKRLANGKYSTIDEIENDVLLICFNAMQYNEPDTVYYKQARTIQELARKKFDRIRSDFERAEKQINTEERNKFNHNRMNLVKRSTCRSSEEPVGSDFVSRAALVSIPGESQSCLNLPRVSSFGKPFNNDGPIEGNVSTMDNDVDKAEDFASAKNATFKFGKKPLSLDENRRSTYKISTQLPVGSDSIFTTFEKEPKELVSVGLQAEYSYARSLARFAGTLGPVAWNIAAKNIKKALSSGVRFGRGWVGEYEPISTPFLSVDTQCNMGPACATALPDISHLNVKVNQKSRAKGPFKFNSCYSNKDHPVNEPVLEGRPSFIPVPDDHPTKRKPLSNGYDAVGPITPVGSISPGRNPFSRNHLHVGAKVGIQDVSFPSTANPDKVSFGTMVQLPKNSVVVSGHGTNQPLSNSMPFEKSRSGGLVSGGVPSANFSMSTFDKNRMAGISSNNVSCLSVRPAAPSGYGEAHQGVSDPVCQMRMLAEKAQNPQNCVAHSPVSSSPALPAVPSSRRYDKNNGSQVSPRSWMSIGSNNINKASPESPRPLKNHISADSLYNPTRDVQQVSRFRGETPGSLGLHFQMEKNHFPNQTYGQENHWLANEAQLQGHSVNMAKLITSDLSRFQVQSPRQSLSFRPQTRQTFPPDLNVGFQSLGSPARQGTQVDHQQPDLALQL